MNGDELNAVIFFLVPWILIGLILGYMGGMRHAYKQIQKRMDHKEPCWRCKGVGFENPEHSGDDV